MSSGFHRERPERERADVTVESPAATAKERGEPIATSAPPSPVSSARRPPPKAWALAVAADLVQWVLLPVFAAGFASPANVALDVVVCAVLVRWCGWHWAFLPSFVAELVPGVGLVPTWTAAVGLAALAKRSERPTA